MTDNLCTMEAVYVDMKFMPGLKVARVSLEIPIERSNEFIQMFGTPDRTDPVWCAVARLQAPKRLLTEPAEPTPAKLETKREYTRSQIAAMRCADPAFQEWLQGARPLEWAEGERRGTTRSDVGAAALRAVLGIASRRELDPEGPKARAFEALLTDFDLRNTVR